jgi:hypothetical protein
VQAWILGVPPDQATRAKTAMMFKFDGLKAELRNPEHGRSSSEPEFPSGMASILNRNFDPDPDISQDDRLSNFGPKIGFIERFSKFNFIFEQCLNLLNRTHSW